MTDRDERAFCHKCGHTWPNPGDRLICLRCRSDFVEIIEPTSSPSARSDTPSDPDMDLDDVRIQIDGSIAGQQPAERSSEPPLFQHEPPGSSRRSRSPSNPFPDHDPWANTEYREYSNGSEMTRRSYRSQDGRFTWTSTTVQRRTRPPNDVDPMADSFPPMIYPLETLFRYLHEGSRDSARGERPPHSGSSEGLHDTDADGPFPSGLFPRDADSPQPMISPIEHFNE